MPANPFGIGGRDDAWSEVVSVPGATYECSSTVTMLWLCVVVAVPGSSTGGTDDLTVEEYSKHLEPN